MIKYFDLQLFNDEAIEGGAEASDSTDSANNFADPVTKAKYTDEDLDKIINKKFAEWQQRQQKAVDEARKLAEMNAQQKAEYERDNLRKELEALKKKDSLAEMTKTARNMLAENSITISDELLSMMVSTEAETTKAAVDSFSEAFKAAVETAVKERLKGNTPRRGAFGGVPAMTKEQIMQIHDPELRQRKMLEYKELFNF